MLRLTIVGWMVLAVTLAAQSPTPIVTFDRILRAQEEPHNWLTYSGGLSGLRHSRLTEITPANVKDLELAWVWQAQSPIRIEATSLVVDGVLYTVEPPNDVVALDAQTGRTKWVFRYTQPMLPVCCGRVNRGLAIHGNTLFMGTLDAHLLAIDASTGKLVWNTVVANATDPTCQNPAKPNREFCYTITLAPLVIKDKVIVGTAGGDTDSITGFGIRGFIAAFDAATGKEAWRFSTIPAPGEPGNETWSGDSWKVGGAGVWVTGSYDPELNLTYWGTGNPAPWGATNPSQPVRADVRRGDNLFSDSLVALDADTGKMRWHYQFTPHDDKDWDAAGVPVLADIDWRGRSRRVVMLANKNGFLYVLDRATGEFLSATRFVEVNWLTGFNEKGRPLIVPHKVSTSDELVLPGSATNWYPPSFSPQTGLFYVAAWERGSRRGVFEGGSGYAAIRAIDPSTGTQKWQFRLDDAIFAGGVLTTASGLAFTGTKNDFYSSVPSAEAIAGGASRATRIQPAPGRVFDRYVYAVDARTGQQLWRFAVTASVDSGAMTYAAGGRQYVAVAAGNTLFAFALRH